MENPQERLQYYKETGQTQQAKLYEQYLRETGQMQDERKPAVRGAAADATGALQRERPDASGDFEAAAPILGGVASLLRDVPGGEAAQSAVRALVRRQSYADARNDIRDAEDEAPALARIPARVAGGALSALALPLSPVMQGMAHGAATSALDSDPERGMGSRVAGAVGRGVSEGALGAAGMVARAVKNAPTGAWRKAAQEIPGVPRAERIVKAFRPKAIEAPSPVVGEIAPKSLDDIAGNLELVPETAENAVVKAVKKYAPDRHRTKAQFDYFAERMGTKAPSAPPVRTTGGLSSEANPLDDNLEELLRQSLARLPKKP